MLSLFAVNSHLPPTMKESFPVETLITYQSTILELTDRRRLGDRLCGLSVPKFFSAMSGLAEELRLSFENINQKINDPLIMTKCNIASVFSRCSNLLNRH